MLVPIKIFGEHFKLRLFFLNQVQNKIDFVENCFSVNIVDFPSFFSIIMKSIENFLILKPTVPNQCSIRLNLLLETTFNVEGKTRFLLSTSTQIDLFRNYLSMRI